MKFREGQSVIRTPNHYYISAKEGKVIKIYEAVCEIVIEHHNMSGRPYSAVYDLKDIIPDNRFFRKLYGIGENE